MAEIQTSTKTQILEFLRWLVYIISPKLSDNVIINGRDTNLHENSNPRIFAVASIPLKQNPIINALKLFSMMISPLLYLIFQVRNPPRTLYAFSCILFQKTHLHIIILRILLTAILS
nr:MAG TPA: hypothetical protein [Caudoviricetes sp.]